MMVSEATFTTDVTWFAIDERNQIGAFVSGRTGPVPKAVYELGYEGRWAPDAFGVFRRLEAEGWKTDPVLDLEGSFPPDQDKPPGRMSLRLPRIGRAHLFLKSTQPVADLVPAGGARIVRSTTGLAVVVDDLPHEIALALFRSEEFLGLLPRPQDQSFPYTAVRAAEMGLFVYDHLCDGAASGPYGRIAFPTQPLTVDRLSEAGRKQLAAIRLPDVDFGRDRHVQPCEKVACLSPYPEYLASDFQTRRPAT